jgi:hypothetical protein
MMPSIKSRKLTPASLYTHTVRPNPTKKPRGSRRVALVRVARNPQAEALYAQAMAAYERQVSS